MIIIIITINNVYIHIYICINDHKWCMQQHACWCIYDHVCILTRDTVAQHGNLTKKTSSTWFTWGFFALQRESHVLRHIWSLHVRMFDMFWGCLWHWPNRDWGIKTHVYLLQVVTHHNWSLLATPESPELTYLCLHITYIYIYHICVNIEGSHTHMYVRIRSSSLQNHPIPQGRAQQDWKPKHHPIQLPSTTHSSQRLWGDSTQKLKSNAIISYHFIYPCFIPFPCPRPRASTISPSKLERPHSQRDRMDPSGKVSSPATQNTGLKRSKFQWRWC